MNRRQFLHTGIVLSSVAALSPAVLPRLFAQQTDVLFELDRPLIPAPSDPALRPEFRNQLAAWRDRRRRELNYSDALYRRQDFRWVPSSFACCFLMLCDEAFYERESGRYKVKEFLIRARAEFGGVDSVVLWHAYPRIGFDDRNQFDFYRDAPGGLAGLRKVVRQFHRSGVKVFIDYNPWDIGTRREGKGDLEALAAMVGALEADGIFLDTMDRGAAELRAGLDAVRRGVVLESEAALPLDRVYDHHLSWAQWFGDSAAPGVLRNKWFERRHQQHQVRRWDRDHTSELHTAWMNGSGMMIWENVFGSWNGWCPRDRSILRAMLPIQRHFGSIFSGEAWTPLVPTQMPEVYASRWEAPGLRLWTLVNRSSEPRDGNWLQIDLPDGERVYDVIAGTEVRPMRVGPGLPTVGGRLAPRGVGCVVAGTVRGLGSGFKAFLVSQRKLALRADWDSTPPVRHAALRRAADSQVYSPEDCPVNMVAIPPAAVRLRTEFRTRECGFYDSTGPEFASSFPRLHGPRVFERELMLGPYAMELTPVTNAEFAEFIRHSSYWPRHADNFLKHWHRGQPPESKEHHPVVYVDLDDARAYARWKGRRLPTEEEWQYAAQGPDGRMFPWGDGPWRGRCNDGTTGTTTPVRAFPTGQSPFGLFDMCGNVWEWTESERTDGHTRFCIVHGGSFYQAQASEWYADGGPRPCGFAAKFLLTWPGLDRCATVGFRCAADLDSPSALWKMPA
jgi:formylglycine-generating enzyme required for sulfatase activity